MAILGLVNVGGDVEGGTEVREDNDDGGDPLVASGKKKVEAALMVDEKESLSSLLWLLDLDGGDPIVCRRWNVGDNR